MGSAASIQFVEESYDAVAAKIAFGDAFDAAAFDAAKGADGTVSKAQMEAASSAATTAPMSKEAPAAAAAAPAAATFDRTGVVVECGSSSTKVRVFGLDSIGGVHEISHSRLSHVDGYNLALLDLLLPPAARAARQSMVGDPARPPPDMAQAQLDIAHGTVAQRCVNFADALQSSLANVAPSVINVVASGAAREAIETNVVKGESIELFREALNAAFPNVAKFSTANDVMEAQWELAAAEAIWDQKSLLALFPALREELCEEGDADAMTSSAVLNFGLITGHNDRVTIVTRGESERESVGSAVAPRVVTIGASTLSKNLEMDEDAWLDDGKWACWEGEIVALLEEGSSLEEPRRTGNFILLGMNAVAIEAAMGHMDSSCTVSEAVDSLRSCVSAFREGGDIAENYKAKHTKARYNVLRVAAMHCCRLAHVLERLLASGARVYGVKHTYCSSGEKLDLDWGLGLFMESSAVLVTG